MWHKQNKNRWKDDGTMNNQSQKLFYDCRQEIAIRLFFQDFIYFGVYHSIYASFELATHGKKKEYEHKCRWELKTMCHKSGQSEATKGTHIKHLKLKNFQPNTKCLLREHASLFSQASPHLSAGFVLFLFYYDHKFLSHAIAHFDLLIELYVTRNINCARDDTKYTRIQRF